MPALPINAQITFLYTRDLHATSRFYQSALGLELVLDQGSCHIFRLVQAAYIGFCERADIHQQPGIASKVIFTLVVDDVDRWYERLVGQGVVFEQFPTYSEKYAIYHCFFRDVNGYLIEIQKFADTGWSFKQL